MIVASQSRSDLVMAPNDSWRDSWRGPIPAGLAPSARRVATRHILCVRVGHLELLTKLQRVEIT
jgi:hypothetical protein